MICKEVMRKLEERWNPSYALEWDNVGLLVGREEKEIKKIFTGCCPVTFCSSLYRNFTDCKKIFRNLRNFLSLILRNRGYNAESKE